MTKKKLTLKDPDTEIRDDVKLATLLGCKTNIATRFEMDISPKMISALTRIKELQECLFHFEADSVCAYGTIFSSETRQMRERACDMEITWKKWVTNQLQEQFNASPLLEGLGIYKESPRLRNFESYDET